MIKGNLSNVYQGDYKKVLCVCSGGLLRSPTIAHTLCSAPYNYNTRSAGTANYALNPVTEDLILWANEVICADVEHEMAVKEILYNSGYDPTKFAKTIFTLEIPDIYEYRNPKLIKIIKEKYNKILKESSSK